MTEAGFSEAERTLLAELLGGERVESDPEVLEQLRRNPALQAEWAALRTFAEGLGDGGAERRREVEDAQRAVTGDDVAAARRAITEQRLGPRSRRRRTWWSIAAAAALLAALAAALWPPRSEGPRSEGHGLGNPLLGRARDDIEIAPKDTAALEVFRWRSTRQVPVTAPGGSLKIVVYRVRDGVPTEDILLQQDGLEGDHWQPSEQDLRVLRAAGDFWWELRSVDSDREQRLQSARVKLPKIGRAAPGPPVAVFAAQLADLVVAGSSEAAVQQVDELLDDPVARNVLRGDRDGVLAAIARTRVAAAGQPYQVRAGYECETARYLVALAFHDAAQADLQRFFATAPDPRPLGTQACFATAVGLILLAELQHRAGEHDAAVATAQRARRVADGSSPTLHAETLGVEARVLLDLGLSDEASKLLVAERQAIARLQAEGPVDGNTLSKFCLLEAEFYLAQDRIEPAIEKLDQYEPQLPPSVELQVVRNVARLARAEMRAEPDREAEQLLRGILADAPPALEQGFERNARAMLVRAAWRRGDLAAARTGLDDLRHRLAGDGTGAERPEPTRGHVAADLETMATHLLLLEHAIEPRPAAELAAQLERHRRAFEQLLAEWAATKVRRGGIGFLAFAHRRQVLTELIRLTASLDGDEAAAHRCAADLLRTQQLTSLARELGTGEATLDEVRSVFTGPRMGVLVFLAEPEGSLLIAFDDRRERLLRLPGSFAIDPGVRELQVALAAAVLDPDRAFAGRRSRARAGVVGERLLTTELRALLDGWDTVTIADYGMLSGLPWECLPWHEDELFGERFAVNMLTSLPAGVALAHTRYHPVAATNVVARLVATLSCSPRWLDADGGGSGVLQSTQMAALMQHYAAGTKMLDQEATRVRVAALGADADITHFLAHGARSDPEQATGLALTPPASGDDGFFGREDAEGLHLQGLVIVSACGAGRTHRRIGDEALYATLGGAFLGAGAHTVVQAAADLRLQTHLRLMTLVHAALARGVPTAAALRDARRTLLPDSDWVERFEHAQVQVFGLGQKPIVR